MRLLFNLVDFIPQPLFQVGGEVQQPVDHAQQFQDVLVLPAAIIQILDQRQFDPVAVGRVFGRGAGLKIGLDDEGEGVGRFGQLGFALAVVVQADGREGEACLTAAEDSVSGAS